MIFRVNSFAFGVARYLTASPIAKNRDSFLTRIQRKRYSISYRLLKKPIGFVALLCGCQVTH